ncbi:MAG: helix-turn-helix domain-containing protein [Promethearchaeota archaeon]
MHEKLDEKTIKKLIQDHELKDVEFKRSYRWDYSSNQRNVKIIEGITKAICAFLNSNNGILLVGVEDNRTIIGLEQDIISFNGKDHLLQDLGRKIDKNIHINAQEHIYPYFSEIDGETILVIEVKKSDTPFFYNNKDFVIREFNSIKRLNLKGKEIYEYFQNKFKFVGNHRKFIKHIYNLRGYKPVGKIVLKIKKYTYLPLFLIIILLFVFSILSYINSLNIWSLSFYLSIILIAIFLLKFIEDCKRMAPEVESPPNETVLKTLVIISYLISIGVIGFISFKAAVILSNYNSLILSFLGLIIAVCVFFFSIRYLIKNFYD